MINLRTEFINYVNISDNNTIHYHVTDTAMVYLTARMCCQATRVYRAKPKGQVSGVTVDRVIMEVRFT